MDGSKYLDNLIKIISSPKFYGPIIAIIISFIIYNFFKKIMNKMVSKNVKTIEQKRKRTVILLIENVVKYIIVIIALLVSLSCWGINVTGFITGLGVAGVVAGLALQDALKDIIMGCNIIFDNYFVVGDLVKFNDFTGEVIEFGLKNTKIRSFDGSVLVVANREISCIQNISYKDSVLLIKIPTAYEEKEKVIRKVLDRIILKIDDLEISTIKTEILGIDELAESSVNYLIKANSKPSDQYKLKRQILSIIKSEFDAANIKIPYQQIEVHNGK